MYKCALLGTVPRHHNGCSYVDNRISPYRRQLDYDGTITRKDEKMARPKQTPEQRIAAIQQKQAQLKARLQKESAKLSGQKRKDDTRRKIIVGALALEHAGIDAAFGEALNRLIFRHVTKPQDRALFGLAPLQEPANGNLQNKVEAAE